MTGPTGEQGSTGPCCTGPTGAGAETTLSSVGEGVSIVFQGEDATFEVKSLVGGVYIGITSSDEEVTINNTLAAITEDALTTLGIDAGVNTPSTSQVTAVGYSALYTNTTGSDNSAVGSYALYNNTSGVENCAFGGQSLYNNTIGGDNTMSRFNLDITILQELKTQDLELMLCIIILLVCKIQPLDRDV